MQSISRTLSVIVSFLIVAFAVTAKALPISDITECSERITANSPRIPFQIQGLDDTDFMGRVAASLDKYWKPKYEAGLTPEDFGLTESNLKTYGLDDRLAIRIPIYFPINVRFYEGEMETTAGTLNDDPPFLDPNEQTAYFSRAWFESKLGDRITNDSSWAFVLAHEAGHNLQAHLRILLFAQEVAPVNRDNFVKRIELQADCLAGIWVGAHRELFTDEDIQEMRKVTLRAGSKFHGTGAQRAKWFMVGLIAETVRDCNTFSIGSSRL